MPGGDVLILAGDICIPTEYDRYEEFFNQLSERYEKIFYVMGNHEQYQSMWGQAEKILRERLPDNIRLLQNQSEYYRGVHFVGATMWTDFNNDKQKMEDARSYMNDYHSCYGLTPEITKEENENTITWFNQCIPMLKMAPIVMITHHAPSYQSVQGRYLNSKEAYANNLEDFIQKNPGITHWIHGHIHHTNDYKVGDCRILSNPRGYEGFEMNPDFLLTRVATV